MPLTFEQVKAQLKVWKYNWVQTVGYPHWPYVGKTTETYTYEYAIPPGRAPGVAQIWQPTVFLDGRPSWHWGDFWSARAHVEENVKAKRKYARKAEKFLRMEAPVRRSERIMTK